LPCSTSITAHVWASNWLNHPFFWLYAEPTAKTGHFVKLIKSYGCFCISHP
jgi:hypothetical protein